MALHRTVLFVPGVDDRRIERALGCPTDAVAIDLEDAVAPGQKDSARRSAIAAVRNSTQTGVGILLRINAADTQWFEADVEALAPILTRLTAVILPKARSTADVHRLDAALTRVERAVGMTEGATRIIPTLESADGVIAAFEIASSSSRVLRMLFGTIDLSAEIGVDPTPGGIELLYARSRVVLASTAAKLAAPLDGPYPVLGDTAGLKCSTEAAKSLGYGGKVTIHPNQLETVTAAFTPTPEQVAWAQEVDAAFTVAEREGIGVIRLPRGSFIDLPVALRARAILEDSGSTAPTLALAPTRQERTS
jgi:citrate lyase subunit beta / citryl-CoA lyase